MAGVLLAAGLCASPAAQAKSYYVQVKHRCDVTQSLHMVIWNRDATPQANPYPGVLKKGTKVSFYSGQTKGVEIVPYDVPSGASFPSQTKLPTLLSCHAYRLVCNAPPGPTPHAGC